MPDINKIAVKITGDESGLKKATKSAQKDINSISSAAASFGDIIKGSFIGNVLADAVSSAFRAITNELDGAIDRLDALKNYSNVMGGLGVAADDSQTSITLLRQGLEGLPTNITDATMAVKRLTSVNGNIQASTEMFLALNNAILAGGSTTEQQASALEQLNQAYAKGRPEMQDWKILLQAMPAQLKQVAQAMGYASSSALYEALQSGTASMDEFMLTVMQLNKQGGPGFASFADQAKSATQGIGTALTTLKYSIQNALATIMDEIGRSNLSGFIQGIASAVGTATKYVAAFVRVLKEAFAWLRALFGGGAGSTDDIVKSTDSAAASLEGAASGAASTASGLDSAAAAAKKLKGQLAGFDEMNVLQEPTSSTGGTGSTAGLVSPEIANFEWDTSGIKKSSDDIEKIAQKIKKALNSIGLTKFAQDVAKAFAQIDLSKLEGPAIRVGESLAGVFSTILGAVDEIAIRMTPIFNFITNFVVPPALQVIATVLNTISALIGGIVDGVVAAYDKYVGPALDRLIKALEPILDAVGELFNWINENTNIFQVFRQVIGTVTEYLIGPMFEGFGMIINIIAGVIEVIVKAISWAIRFCTDTEGAVKELTTAIGNFFQEAWNRIAGFFGGIGQWFKDRWNDIKNAFGNPIQWFSDIFNGAWNAIVGAFSGVWNTFTNIGANIWNGIKNGLGDLAGKMKNLFKGAVDAVKNFLGIHSPSTLFASMGKYVDQGFTNGIEENMGEVHSALSQLTDGVENRVETLQESAAGIGTALGAAFGQTPQLADLGADDLATQFDNLTAKTQATLSMENDETVSSMGALAAAINNLAEQGQRVTVKIGEDTIMDKIIGGINDASAMRNRNVLNL